MDTIIEALEKEIPPGRSCHDHNGWCEYHEIKKPSLAENGTTLCYYCHLIEGFVNRKKCGINED